MHLINEAIIFRINNSATRQEFIQQSRPSRSIDSSEPRHYAAATEDYAFRFKQDAARLSDWCCVALFRDARTIALRVNGGAARTKQFSSRKRFEESVRAIEGHLQEHHG